ncbi:unnamed protein product [Ectocarpus sp. 6 AP-2014]
MSGPNLLFVTCRQRLLTPRRSVWPFSKSCGKVDRLPAATTPNPGPRVHPTRTPDYLLPDRPLQNCTFIFFRSRERSCLTLACEALLHFSLSWFCLSAPLYYK